MEMFHLIDEKGKPITMTKDDFEKYNEEVLNRNSLSTLKADVEYYLAHGYTPLEQIYHELKEKYEQRQMPFDDSPNR